MASTSEGANVKYLPKPKKVTAHANVAPTAALKRHHVGPVAYDYIEDPAKRSKVLSKRKPTLFTMTKRLVDLTGVSVKLAVKTKGITYEYNSADATTTDEPGGQSATVTGPLADPADHTLSPKRLSCSKRTNTTADVGVQCAVVQLGGINKGSEQQCRGCGVLFEKDSDSDKKLWMGCDESTCTYWVHSFCLGFDKSVKPKTLKSIKWKCPIHRN